MSTQPSARSTSISRTRTASSLVACSLAWSLASSFACSLAAAQLQVPLSPYLGVGSGQATCNSNPPFMEALVCADYAYGRDCPGSFSSGAVRFIDTAPLPSAIGMHPPRSGQKSLRFDLDAFRDAFGREPTVFEALVGIDVPSGGNSGATFTVTLDDGQGTSTIIQSAATPSQSIQIPVTGVRFLKLSVSAFSTFNGNHAAWGIPRLTFGSECPAPVLGEQPRNTNACPGSTVQLRTIGSYWGTFSYQWRKNGTNITLQENDSAQSATLNIFGVSEANNGSYDCVVSNSCGSTLTRVASVRVCASDFNCDGITDFFDYLDFVSVFAGGTIDADFNHDDVVDFFDYLDFVAVFANGC